MTTTMNPRTAASHSIRRSRAVAVAAAVFAALLVWSIGVPVLGVDLTVRTGPEDSGAQTIGPTLMVAVSALAALAGWALLAVLERYIHRVGAIWSAAAGVVLLASLTGPLTGATSTSAALTLVAIHAAVAVVLIPLLARTAKWHWD